MIRAWKTKLAELFFQQPHRCKFSTRKQASGVVPSFISFTTYLATSFLHINDSWLGTIIQSSGLSFKSRIKIPRHRSDVRPSMIFSERTICLIFSSFVSIFYLSDVGIFLDIYLIYFKKLKTKNNFLTIKSTLSTIIYWQKNKTFIWKILNLSRIHSPTNPCRVKRLKLK